ncbi:hypothetical protein [Streptomonospora litoralis]|uniref:Uncharacterized protein n=1 Tax=Streptomonospora litoralis TaxID=2498135 RepID=A0A4P6Q9E4_9ACTN|nr:hypothetical protein [Streptomonospora litoralis]QBI55854.1 hypothetical protein EKD16_20465 [Streptomonospora litoralis]
MPDHPENPTPEQPAPDDPPPEPGRHSGGSEYPRGHHAPGGYHFPEPAETPEPTLPLDPPIPDADRPAAEPQDDSVPVAAERFRRVTPARRKAIPDARGKGYWRLGISTALFVMFTGSWADSIAPLTRAGWHLVFWALLGTAALVALYRERRNGWPPSPRWPWPAAAVAGTVAAEILVATVGSPAVMIGSVVVLGIGLFLALLFG